MPRDRCAGDVIIIEVNRPPTQGCGIDTESPRSRNDVIRESPPSCLEQAEGPPHDGYKQDRTVRCRRKTDEEFVYVELDVDCASVNRQNVTTRSSKYDENAIGYLLDMFNLTNLNILNTFQTHT